MGVCTVRKKKGAYSRSVYRRFLEKHQDLDFQIIKESLLALEGEAASILLQNPYLTKKTQEELADQVVLFIHRRKKVGDEVLRMQSVLGGMLRDGWVRRGTKAFSYLKRWISDPSNQAPGKYAFAVAYISSLPFTREELVERAGQRAAISNGDKVLKAFIHHPEADKDVWKAAMGPEENRNLDMLAFHDKALECPEIREKLVLEGSEYSDILWKLWKTAQPQERPFLLKKAATVCPMEIQYFLGDLEEENLQELGTDTISALLRIEDREVKKWIFQRLGGDQSEQDGETKKKSRRARA